MITPEDSSTQEIIQYFASDTGWNRDTQFLLICQWLDDHPDAIALRDDLRMHLTSLRDEEMGISTESADV